MRVGIVGCGDIAGVHIPFVLEDQRHEIVAVCDAASQRAEALARRFKIDKVYGNFAQLLAEQAPDVVHVLTPPQTHAALTLQAVQAGCHVLVEKPMALSVEEADAMMAAAHANGVKLCIDHNQLFEPVILHARQLLAEGIAGSVIGLESFYGFNLAQTSERQWVRTLPGGVLQNLAPHPLSLMLEFLGEPQDLHTATVATGLLGPQVPDELRVLMKGNDAVGTLTISLAIRPHLNFLRIYGSKAILHADLANMILSVERLRALPKAAARGLMSIEQGVQLASGAVRTALQFALGRLKPYQGMGNLIREFYRSIEDDSAPPVSGEAGRRVLRAFERICAGLPIPATAPSTRSAPKKGGSKAFVTGASGFVGSHLVEKLAQQGVAVRALVRPTSRIGHLSALDIEWTEGDLGSIEKLQRAMEGCDVVYHCAATTNGSWGDYLEGTIRGTERLLAASAAEGVKRFVYVSSLSVYGVKQLGDHAWVAEEAAIEPQPEERGDYTHAKVEAERLVLSYSQGKGLPVSIVRPGTIYGPRGKVFFPRIGYALKNKLFIIIGRGNHLLPLAYVENVADAIWLAGTRDEAIGQIYNIVDDDKITQQEYLNEFLRRAGLKGVVLHVPFSLMYMLASLLEAQAGTVKMKSPPLLSRYRLVSATKDLRYATSRAKKHLGWTPHVSLEEGLRRTFEWYNGQRRGHRL